MPIYEYVCRDCGNDFEVLVRNSDAKPECPKCESKNLKRKMSTFSASVPSSGGCPAAASCPSASSSCGCGCGCGHKH